jgi:RecA/RadA recombinase
MNNIFSDLIKEAGNEYAALVDDGIEAGDVTGYIGTGSYALNALLSGSIYGGLPDNKITALAGEPATGKTFYTLNVVKQFLIDNPNGGVMYFESESALTKQMFIDRDIDARRVHIIPVTTIQEFRTQCVKILDKYMETPAANRPPMIMVLDSLGNLSTEKEIADITDGKDTRDMTRAQLIRGAFRVITLKLGKAKVALLVTNHTYDVVGSYIPTKKMGGGCLVAGTKIQTPEGLVEIQNLKVGDFVSTLYGDKEVTKTFIFNDKEVFELSFDDGTIVRCSGDHKFLVNGVWLSVNDMLVSAKNMETLNIEVADMKGDLDVYGQQIYKNILLASGSIKAA